MTKKTGLGRGLDSLFLDNAASDEGSAPSRSLQLSEIEPNREQPRKSFDSESLKSLADSIRQKGVLQPLLVRPLPGGNYQLVAGERRWRAARLAGLSEVPVIIKELSDVQAAEIALIENLQREDLNPIEEAEGFRLLIDSYGLTQDEASERVGRSRSAVANSLRLLLLPEELKKLIEEKKLSAGHARALLSFGEASKMNEIAELAMKKELSVREVEKLAKENSKPARKRSPKKRDIFYDEAEIALKEALGRRVKISASKKGGTLEIEFFDKEDLIKLTKQLDTE